MLKDSPEIMYSFKVSKYKTFQRPCFDGLSGKEKLVINLEVNLKPLFFEHLNKNICHTRRVMKLL